MPHVDALVVDGNNLAHRAWHASGATQYQASVTLTTMVRHLIRDHTPRFACVAFDAPTCFRKRLYPEYKAQRLEKAEPLDDWLESLRGLDRIAGARVNVAADHEADDVLATLAAQCRRGLPPIDHRLTCLLCTSDQDAYALVGGPVAVGLVSSAGHVRYVSSRGVEEKLGVPTWQVPLYKALVGDSSDNVPGVPGIGPKRAVALLHGLEPVPGQPMSAYFEEVLGRLTSPPASTRVGLEAARDLGRAAYRVLRLRASAPVRWSIEQCRVSEG